MLLQYIMSSSRKISTSLSIYAKTQTHLSRSPCQITSVETRGNPGFHQHINISLPAFDKAKHGSVRTMYWSIPWDPSLASPHCAGVWIMEKGLAVKGRKKWLRQDRVGVCIYMMPRGRCWCLDVWRLRIEGWQAWKRVDAQPCSIGESSDQDIASLGTTDQLVESMLIEVWSRELTGLKTWGSLILLYWGKPNWCSFVLRRNVFNRVAVVWGMSKAW